MKKWMIIMTVLTFLAVSCKKKVTITGRVYNPVTNEGISGVKVTLSKQKTGVPGSVDGSGANILASGFTDANGNYSFIEKLNKNKSYGIGFSKDDDLYYQIEGEYKIVDAGETNIVINWPLVPLGNLSKNTVNINCFDENDVFVVNALHRSIPSLSGTATYNGCFSHYGNTNKVPMGWYVYTGTVTKNNITTPFADSIYVTEGGNHIWNIEY